MRKAVLCLGLLLASLHAAHAEVLIYHGAGTFVASPGSALPPNLRVFLLLDVQNQQTATIFYFAANGQKRQQPTAATVFEFTTAPLGDSGTERVISRSLTSSSPPNYDHALVFFRGAQKRLVVASKPLPIARDEPSIIKGLFVEAIGSETSGFFSDCRISVAYQEAATVKANNAGSSINQVLNELSAALAAKGYQPL